jgi:hypothetical protein
MITIFNRKVLTRDTSQEECGRVKLILQENGIPYYYKTIRSISTLNMQTQARASIAANIAYNDHAQFVYTIYVSRSDYDYARKLAYGSCE